MLPLTDADRQTLLRIARESLVGYLQAGEIPEFPQPDESLRQPCGAFVTLRRGKNLRGCIGVIEALQPLYTTVSQCAVWAATHDRRFPPVTQHEVDGLTFEISVLSPLEDIVPENVVVGRHGLIVSRGGMRGLLLPQVPLEWNWDREEFLMETCRKAGLPPDAWRHGARIQAFTAHVFEENPSTQRSPQSSHPAA